jgi:hypothetical protein
MVGIGLAGVLVADGRREEFEKAKNRVLTSLGNQTRIDEDISAKR